MKGFEKYISKRWSGQMTEDDPIYTSHEKTWRAALEMVKRNSDILFESEQYGYYYDIPANIIDDELET